MRSSNESEAAWGGGGAERRAHGRVSSRGPHAQHPVFPGGPPARALRRPPSTAALCSPSGLGGATAVQARAVPGRLRRAPVGFALLLLPHPGVAALRTVTGASAGGGCEVTLLLLLLLPLRSAGPRLAREVLGRNAGRTRRLRTRRQSPPACAGLLPCGAGAEPPSSHRGGEWPWLLLCPSPPPPADRSGKNSGHERRRCPPRPTPPRSAVCPLSPHRQPRE